jgi:predicted TIM-barrel fold metal-dependent hydrolase
MDTDAVLTQVISHTPSIELPALDICKAANDELYQAIQNHKTRYAGFAMFLMNDPHAAAAELERCVKDLGLVGHQPRSRAILRR